MSQPLFSLPQLSASRSIKPHHEAAPLTAALQANGTRSASHGASPHLRPELSLGKAELSARPRPTPPTFPSRSRRLPGAAGRTKGSRQQQQQQQPRSPAARSLMLGPLSAELARILPGGEEEEKKEAAPPASARRAGELRCGGAGGESESGALPGYPRPGCAEQRAPRAPRLSRSRARGGSCWGAAGGRVGGGGL